MGKRFVEAWDGPRKVVCSTCGVEVDNGMRLILFDERERCPVRELESCTCIECHNQRYRDARAARKAQLAAEPRCEIDGCQHRGNWRAAGVLLCGRHMRQVKIGHARVAAQAGWLAMTMQVDRTDILGWAKGK